LRQRAYSVLVVLAFPAGRWVRSRYWESPEQRTLRLCRSCGLNDTQITALIDDIRHTTLTREAALALLFATFGNAADAEMCLPCGEAVLTAAGRS
jgi:hypothetical protein